MVYPTGLHRFAQAFPDRCFDVGIAEQHAVTSAAGLAMGGLHPVVAVYSTFLNRAFDQVLMDVALHRCGVTFVLDRAGITGPDGPAITVCGTCRSCRWCPASSWRRRATACGSARRLARSLAIDDAPERAPLPQGPGTAGSSSGRPARRHGHPAPDRAAAGARCRSGPARRDSCSGWGAAIRPGDWGDGR